MAIQLSRSFTRSIKGQRSTTNSNQTQNSNSTSTTVTNPSTDTQVTEPSTDTQVANGAVTVDISFTIPFQNTDPVTPIGETEPEGTC